MEYRDDIVRFAEDWIGEIEGCWSLEDISFEQLKADCEALGFRSKNGEIPEIDTIDDIDELGSALLEMCGKILKNKYMINEERGLWAWFDCALDRLDRLARGCFFGTPDRIKIDSAPCFFRRPLKPGDQTNQTILIKDSGKVRITRTIYGEKQDTIKIQKRQIDPSSAKKLLDAFAKHFGQQDPIGLFATDVGSWDVKMRNTKGQKYSFRGSLSREPIGLFDTDLSDLVRDTLNMDDLYVLDRNILCESIWKITMEYRGETEKKMCTERLVLDRKTETIELERNDENGNSIRHTYKLNNIVRNLLNQFDDEELLSLDEEAEPVFDDQAETRTYRLMIDYTSTSETIEGTFCKNGLPVGYEDFVKKISDVLKRYGDMNLFDPRIYDQVLKEPKYYTYCAVVFDEGGRSYSYLVGDDALQEGDMVLVPTGKFDHISMARVETVETYREDDVPYPISKTKRVIKKCTPEEAEYFSKLKEMAEQGKNVLQ